MTAELELLLLLLQLLCAGSKVREGLCVSEGAFPGALPQNFLLTIVAMS